MGRSPAFTLVCVVLAAACRSKAEDRRALPHAWPTPGVREGLLSSPQPNSAAASIVELIARPADFDGKAISVIGFANLEFEGQGLYLHREDYVQGLPINALWVDIDLTPEVKALNGRYVIVTGVFEAKHAGSHGMYRGRIKQVSRYDPWPTREELAGYR